MEVLTASSSYSWIPDEISISEKFRPLFSQSDIVELKLIAKEIGQDILFIDDVLPSESMLPDGIALTKAMSLDLAKYGILVNTICIGLIKSGQIDRATQSAFPDLDLAEAYAERGKSLPLGRVGEASEVADLITFLVSDRGSYITGSAINADGGSSAVV